MKHKYLHNLAIVIIVIGILINLVSASIADSMTTDLSVVILLCIVGVGMMIIGCFMLDVSKR